MVRPGVEVSSEGRVRSWRRRGKYPGTTTTPKILKPYTRPDGYVSVGNPPEYVHRLVAEAFYGSCPEGKEVRHLNGRRSDDRACNLQWGTRVENQADRRTHGTHMAGDTCPASKLGAVQVREIRANERNETRADLAARFGVSVGAIKAIRANRTWLGV